MAEQSDIVRGNPVSGKVWKSVQTKRNSSMVAHKKGGWERQQKERRQREILMAMKREKEEEKAQEEAVSSFFLCCINCEWISNCPYPMDQAAKKAKEDRLKRKATNEQKAEVVQKVC